VEIIEAKSLGELAAEAAKKCEERTITNLILRGEFPYKEVDSEFIKMNDDVAQKWQTPIRPVDLFINHGEHINRFGDGKEFLVDELRRKKDSNRACLSLLNMGDIIGSGDKPIPSFLILQFGFAEDSTDKILVAAYFRALEVSQFLPINLSEISQYIRFFKSKFPTIERFELTIMAFRAHLIRQFHCLRKAAIDAADPVDIAIAVERGHVKTIRQWIDSKMTVSESVICTDGLEVLYKALMRCEEKYEEAVRNDIKEVLDAMKQLREIREVSSHSELIDKLNKDIRRKLLAAREKVK